LTTFVLINMFSNQQAI